MAMAPPTRAAIEAMQDQLTELAGDIDVIAETIEEHRQEATKAVRDVRTELKGEIGKLEKAIDDLHKKPGKDPKQPLNIKAAAPGSSQETWVRGSGLGRAT